MLPRAPPCSSAVLPPGGRARSPDRARARRVRPTPDIGGRADRAHVDNGRVADSSARDSRPEGAARGRRDGGAGLRRLRLRPARRRPRPRALPDGRHQPIPGHRHGTGPAGEAGPLRQPRPAARERHRRAAPAVLRPRRPRRRPHPAHRPHRAARRRRRAGPARLACAQRRRLLPGHDGGADGPRAPTAHHHQGPGRHPHRGRGPGRPDRAEHRCRRPSPSRRRARAAWATSSPRSPPTRTASSAAP